MSIAENLNRLREEIAAACKTAGRSSEEVTLMAVSKTHPVSAILEAAAAGCTLFGENRVQEFEQKSAVRADTSLRVHLIGPLQSNKAARAAALFDGIDTLDSLKLALRLNDAAAKLDKRLSVLLEIKLSHEESKHGLLPGSQDLAELLERLPDLANLDIRGLMTIAPLGEDPRPCFRQLRRLREELSKQNPRLNLRELSMGMSGDFAVAIAEGSTCVRIGTAIFGTRAGNAQ
jgi:hypothetical protein